MWCESKTLIDNFNPRDFCRYEVVEEIEHHYYVRCRRINKCKVLYASVAPTSLDYCMAQRDYWKKEFQNEAEANKFWSGCMARQLTLF